MNNPIIKLAFLVNESRARIPELSRDYVSRYWVPPNDLPWVSDFWDRFSSIVYPDDDVVLSLRNQFFLNRLSVYSSTHTAFVNIGAGLTSYPYDLAGSMDCIEVDLPELIEYKVLRRRALEASGDIKSISVVSVAADVTEGSILGSRLDDVVKVSVKKVYLIEGLSYYLSPVQWEKLIVMLE